MASGGACGARMLWGDTGHRGSSQNHPDEQNRKTVARMEKEHFPGVT